MRKASIVIAVLWVSALAIMWWGHHAHAATRGLTNDMILTALESAHVCVRPGCELKLIDRAQGAAGWRTFRLDTFSIRVRDGKHFVIEGQTTEIK